MLFLPASVADLQASHLSARALSELVSAVAGQEGAFERKDLDLALALTRFMEAALIRCGGWG